MATIRKPLQTASTYFLGLLPALLLLLLAAPPIRAQDSSPTRPADPYADPAHDIFNPLRYIASNTLTAIATTLILITALCQTWMMVRVGGKYMLALVIAEYTFAIGFAFRFALHANPESIGIYIIENMLVILSPCGFIAADYVLLGRISQWLQCDRHLLIPPKRITLVFVLSDVFTFLVQGSGGGISASRNQGSVQTGSHIFLAGLALQLASFVIFSIVFSVFLLRVYKHEPAIWNKDNNGLWYNDWRSLAGALAVSCIGILIRSVYRTIELSQGYTGKIATTEGLFYGFDTLPLFLAISVYTPFWPGRFIPPFDGSQRLDNDKVEMDRLRVEFGRSFDGGERRLAGAPQAGSNEAVYMHSNR